MKSSLFAGALALLFAATLAACSSSSSTTTSTSTDTSASSAAADSSASSDATSSADSSASSSAASNGGSSSVAVYPGATETDKAGSMGTPPPGAKAYVTTDSVAKVSSWYTTNVAGMKVVTSNGEKGAILQVGDPKTGTTVIVMPEGGKTYIGITPTSLMK